MTFPILFTLVTKNFSTTSTFWKTGHHVTSNTSLKFHKTKWTCFYFYIISNLRDKYIFLIDRLFKCFNLFAWCRIVKLSATAFFCAKDGSTLAFCVSWKDLLVFIREKYLLTIDTWTPKSILSYHKFLGCCSFKLPLVLLRSFGYYLFY